MGCENGCTCNALAASRVVEADAWGVQGATWTEPRVHMKDWNDNLFGEQVPDNHTSKVKFGAPHVGAC